MSDPEEKQKRLKRRSNYAKSLEKKQYRQKKIEDKKKKIDLSTLTHQELIELIQEEGLTDDED